MNVDDATVTTTRAVTPLFGLETNHWRGLETYHWREHVRNAQTILYPSRAACTLGDSEPLEPRWEPLTQHYTCAGNAPAADLKYWPVERLSRQET